MNRPASDGGNINSYTVTFNVDGGTEISQQKINKNGLISKPAEPEKREHIFIGWYKELTFENEWDFDSDKVTSDITLYSKWVGSVVNGITYAKQDIKKGLYVKSCAEDVSGDVVIVSSIAGIDVTSI